MRFKRAWIGFVFCLMLTACAIPATATPGPAFYTALAPALSDLSPTPPAPLTSSPRISAVASAAAVSKTPLTADQLGSQAGTDVATGATALEPSATPTLPPASGTDPAVTRAAAPTRAPSSTQTQPRPTLAAGPSSVGPATPLSYETTVTILTYDYQQAFQQTQPGDPIFPYPRLDFTKIGPPEPYSYQALVLENGYVSLTILPELGGRIYRWVDKATGRHLLYENKVVKPTQWGYRGWWLGVGGIEWAFPVEEHGLNEWRQWTYATGYTVHGLSVTVSNVEDRTGMEVGVTISLDADHAYVTLQPWAENNTAEPHSYQLWLNGMLTLGGDTVSDETQLIIPADQVLIHTTGDTGVPGSGTYMNWPVHAGRDMSWYGNWHARLGFFAPFVSWGFVGLYDHSADQGIVRAFDPGWPPGTKFFSPKGISPSTWTDDESLYIELWSGATRDFGEDATLKPGESVRWTERWYPVSGMGGYTFANESAALRLIDTGGGAEVGVAVSAFTNGHLTLWAGDQLVANWPINLYPGQAFKATWFRPSHISGSLGLKLESSSGFVLGQTGQVP